MLAPNGRAGEGAQPEMAGRIAWRGLLEVSTWQDRREHFSFVEHSGQTVGVPPAGCIGCTEDRLRHAEFVGAARCVQFGDQQVCVEAV